MNMDMSKATPLAAAFFRGFMTKAREGDQGLRDCGEAGKAQVENLDMEISPQYITKLTRNLVSYGVMVKARKGRHYVVARGERWDDFFKWFDDEAPEGWGETNREDQEWPDRAKVINLKRLGLGLRSRAKELIPVAAFRQAQSFFKSGEYDVVFIPANQQVKLLVKREGKWVTSSSPKVWSKIDHDEMQRLIDEMDGDDE